MLLTVWLGNAVRVPEALMTGTVSVSALNMLFSSEIRYKCQLCTWSKWCLFCLSWRRCKYLRTTELPTAYLKKKKLMYLHWNCCASQCLLSHCLLWWLNLTFYQALFQWLLRKGHYVNTTQLLSSKLTSLREPALKGQQVRNTARWS